MLMDAEVDGSVDGPGGGVCHKPRLVQVILNIGVVLERAVTLGDRQLVHQKVCANDVDGHRVLGDKHAGGIIPVERSLLPFGIFAGDGRSLGRGADECVQHVEHRLAAHVFVGHQIHQRAVNTHFVLCEPLVQAGPLRRTHGVAVEKGAEMVFTAEGDAVAVPLEVGQVDDVLASVTQVGR